MTRLLVTTACGSLSSEAAPVGGGVAVLEALLPHLARAFDVTVLCAAGSARATHEGGVRRLELAVPCLADLPRDGFLHLGERAYARFALEWEGVLARHLADVDPRDTVLLANDVSEGPPFAELARRGLRQAVLYHVCVAGFFARRYLRGPLGLGVPSAAAARAWQAAERLGLGARLPDVARLVWRKEGDAARHALAIVPSVGLARELARAYPASGVAARTLVTPWGVVGTPDPARRAGRSATLERLGLDPRRRVLLSLSRVSPEKRLELAARALERLERRRPELADGLAWVVAGGPAYMNGAAYLERVRTEARRLRRVTVRFVGHVSGEAKWDLLAAADRLLSTSSYEAYGLTIAQALASGTPVVATDHQGARTIVEPAFGRVVRPRAGELALALAGELGRTDEAARREAAARFGREHPFAAAARRVVDALRPSAQAPRADGVASRGAVRARGDVGSRGAGAAAPGAPRREP